MRVWTTALLLVGFLLTAPLLLWSAGSKAQAPFPTPIPTATATPQPPGEGTQGQVCEPSGPPDLAHRQKVLQRFPCTNCHGLDYGWPLPASHALVLGQDCQRCHLPVPQPPAIAIHATPGETLMQEPCNLCHGDITGQTPPVATPREGCSACHGKEVREVLPSSHEGRSLATCQVCHEVRLLPTTVVPHRTDGWERCSFCHGERRLTALDGGHQGRSDEQCLLCHSAAVRTPPALPRQMLILAKANDGCMSCHGPGAMAPLPASHSGRAEVVCRLCHGVAAEQPPLVPHPLAGRSACDDCHTPARLGALPSSHATRTEQTCVACHQELPGGVPPIPHTLKNRTTCTDCHVPSPASPALGP